MDRVAVHLGHNQRHLGIHAPVAALVDDYATSLDRPRHKFLGDLIRRAADGQVDASERLRSQFFNRVVPACKRYLLTG